MIYLPRSTWFSAVICETTYSKIECIQLSPCDCFKDMKRKLIEAYPQALSDKLSPQLMKMRLMHFNMKVLVTPLHEVVAGRILLHFPPVGFALVQYDPRKRGFFILFSLGLVPSLALRATFFSCLLYTSPSPRDRQKSRMPSSA